MKTIFLCLVCFSLFAESWLESTLKLEEGFSSTVYLDHLGNPTIGYGHRTVKNAAPITKIEAEAILAADIAKAMKNVKSLVGKDAPLEVKQIVTTMVFQIGFEGVSKFKTMLKCIKAKDYKGAAAAMLDSKWAKQTPERAKRMSELMRNVK